MEYVLNSHFTFTDRAMARVKDVLGTLKIPSLPHGIIPVTGDFIWIPGLPQYSFLVIGRSFEYSVEGPLTIHYVLDLAADLDADGRPAGTKSPSLSLVHSIPARGE